MAECRAQSIFMADEDPYFEYRAVLERAIRTTCRKFRVSPVDAEDFAGELRLRLVKNDWAIFRQFQGRGSIEVYLLVVVTRALHDWRNTRWGKWRPSAEARKIGPWAVRLETLTVRDGHSQAEAREILRTNLGCPLSPAVLDGISARLPARTRRTQVGADLLEQHIANTGAPDDLMNREIASITADRASAALALAQQALPELDRLILRLRFDECLAVVEISRVLQLEQKPLYRRIARILNQLRQALEGAGLTGPVVASAMAEGGFDVQTPRRSAHEASTSERPQESMTTPATERLP